MIVSGLIFALAYVATILNILGARKLGRTWKRQGTDPRLE